MGTKKFLVKKIYPVEGLENMEVYLDLTKLKGEVDALKNAYYAMNEVPYSLRTPTFTNCFTELTALMDKFDYALGVTEIESQTNNTIDAK